MHKENIDKVPNAIKGRDNITLEICGMDNVPEEDIIEHEKQKGNIIEGSGGGGGDDDDDPPTQQQAQSTKQSVSNIHAALPHIAPPPPFSMMGMMPPMPHIGMMGHHMPMMPMMMPPPPANQMMMMPPHLMQPIPVTSSNTATNTINFSNTITNATNPINNNINTTMPTGNPTPVKPLFPSAVNLDTDADRYSSSATNGTNGQKVKIETITSGSKIIHPDEDISLVSLEFIFHRC